MFLNDYLFFNKSNDNIRLSSLLQPDSVVDGPGIRSVIWTQGCIHNCQECHNPETHSICGGFDYKIEQICNEIKKCGYDITFSGGDPFLQPIQCAVIAKFAKEIGLNIWAYSGFLFEDLVANQKTFEFLSYVDVLVDGKFEIQNKSLECKFRGSTNQRLVDVQRSIMFGTVVEWKDPMSQIQRNNSEFL